MNNLVVHIRGGDWSESAPAKIESLAWQDLGLQETVSGYGQKLTSQYKLMFNNRWYRIYYTCFSNAASHWVRINGEKCFITFIN